MQGVAYVISWKSGPTSSLATHFRRAILSALRSSSATGPWDAFQIANASFQIHCAQLNAAREKSHENLAHAEPILLGAPSSKTMDEQEVEHTETSVQVYDDMTDVRFLVCSEATYPNSSAFGAIVDGLSALLTIEARGVRLLHRVRWVPFYLSCDALQIASEELLHEVQLPVILPVSSFIWITSIVPQNSFFKTIPGTLQ
jgi:hypothetical protein